MDFLLNQGTEATNQTEITPDTDPAMNFVPQTNNGNTVLPVEGLYFATAAEILTYIKFTVPFISMVVFVLPLYLGPMMKALRRFLHRGGNPFVETELRDAINSLFTGVLIIPIAFAVATLSSSFPFDVLVFWTTRRSPSDLKALNKTSTFNMWKYLGLVVAGINTVFLIGFAIFGFIYLNINALGAFELIVWQSLISIGIMQVL